MAEEIALNWQEIREVLCYTAQDPTGALIDLASEPFTKQIAEHPGEYTVVLVAKLVKVD